MRYNPYPRSEYLDTSRKRGNIVRGQRKERDALPLLAEIIGEQQPSVDEVMEKRIAQHAKTEQFMRDHRAGRWREARRRLEGHGDNIQPILRDYWNGHRHLPADPMYLLDMLRSYDIGRLQTFATFKAALGEPVEPITPLSMVERVEASRKGTIAR